MSFGCESEHGPHMCELSEGHDGPHRVRYRDAPDKTWTDEEAHGEQGLHKKYEVTKDGEPQEAVFILKPESDSAARKALSAYADETENYNLASDLREWVNSIEEGSA